MQGFRARLGRNWPRGAWNVVAALLVAAALVLWPTVGVDAAFAAAALGIVAWFLNVREQLKLKNPEAFADVDTTDAREEVEEEDGEEFDEDESPREDDDAQAQREDSRPT
ncbi:MAG TPA: hypothetical protein VFX96_07975 [Pyrinomonadaceae bacterium]|nr:hypothetical protein [Pyrinomonadaceae bacterium]